ncbi:MAG: GTPase HflX, partial [Gemmatimonadetes bacterium]|nr:GTPase HflX [Gemmatimonadota bacterium]
MHEMHEIPRNTRERALLVGMVPSNERVGEMEESLDELALLADTAGAEIVDRMIQVRSAMHPAYYIGTGKARSIAELCEAEEIDLVIFDDDLTPAQVRNLDRVIERRILDRSGLILDIFASRAKSKQAKLQVEL